MSRFQNDDDTSQNDEMKEGSIPLDNVILSNGDNSELLESKVATMQESPNMVSSTEQHMEPGTSVNVSESMNDEIKSNDGNGTKDTRNTSDDSQIEQLHVAEKLASQPVDEKQTTLTNG